MARYCSMDTLLSDRKCTRRRRRSGLRGASAYRHHEIRSAPHGPIHCLGGTADPTLRDTEDLGAVGTAFAARPDLLVMENTESDFGPQPPTPISSSRFGRPLHSLSTTRQVRARFNRISL